MDATEKKRLLAYSAQPKRRPNEKMFKNWREFERKAVIGQDGAPMHNVDGSPVMEDVQIPQWSFDATVNWIRKHGRQIARQACDEGWHMRLLDYVSHRHRLPSANDIEDMIYEQKIIDRANLPASCYETRERRKSELLAPLKPQAQEAAE